MTLKSRYEQTKTNVKTNAVVSETKKHIKKHKEAYLVGIAGITILITRDIVSQSISPGISGTANRGISVIGKKIVMNNVSLISSNRSGPPSWVVRCIETGDIFSSQHAASNAMNVSESELSKHLNGLMNHVRGYTFERICLAA